MEACPRAAATPAAKITGAKKVSVEVKAAGDVSDYDATKKATVEAAMAKVAGVEANAVTVTVKAGSVILDFVIITADPAAAAAVKATVATALKDKTLASTALGVTVTAVPTVAVRLAPPSPPPNERPSPLPHLVGTLAYCKPSQVGSGTPCLSCMESSASDNAMEGWTIAVIVACLCATGVQPRLVLPCTYCLLTVYVLPTYCLLTMFRPLRIGHRWIRQDEGERG